MNLKEYIEKLNKLYTKYGDLELVYSKDDEGNEFNYLNFDKRRFKSRKRNTTNIK